MKKKSQVDIRLVASDNTALFSQKTELQLV